MQHIRPAVFRSEDGNPFAALGRHVAAEDRRKAKGLAQTAAARKANRQRSAAKRRNSA